MEKNNIVCMECTDLCDFFYVALDYINQRCDGSFRDDVGSSTCVLTRLLLAGNVHFREGMGNPTFVTDSVKNLVARNMMHHSLSFVVDDKLGEGVVDRFDKCVTYAVGRICIWDISKALKWGKVLMQIFAAPRNSWFLARTLSFVHWYGSSCARTWRIFRWCGYGYGIW